MREKKKGRTFLSIILSFGLAVFLFLLSVGAVLQLGYLSKNGLTQQFAKTGYARETVRIAAEKIKLYLVEKGLTEEFADSLADEDKYYREFTVYAENTLQSKAAGNAAAEMKAELKTALFEYFSAENVYETDALEQTVEETVSECGRIYEKYLHPNFIRSYAAIADKYASGIMILEIVGAIGACMCVFALWLMYHYKHRALRYIIYAVISVTLWHGILALLFSRSVWLSEAKAGPEIYLVLVRSYLSYGLGLQFLMIGAGVVVAILLRIRMKYLKHNIR